jgi:hypothetical protein
MRIKILGKDIFMLWVLMIGVVGICFGQTQPATSSIEGSLSDDGMAGLITVLFTLFLASTVNERIIEFIKLQYPNLYLKSTDQEEELKRHKRVWWVAFGIGVFTSMFMEIDFEFLTSSGVLKIKTLTDVMEISEPTKETPMRIGGFLLSSLFLSLGSKFWHDILDIVLFAKNAKRKLSEFDPNSVRNIGQIDQFVAADDYEMALKALEGHRKELEKTYPGASFSVSWEKIKGREKLCVFVITNGNTRNILEKQINSIRYVTDTGYVYTFPIVVVVTSEAEILNESSDSITAGGVLFNEARKSNKGTFGCIVKDRRDGCKENQILTCYHCVKADGHRWKEFKGSEKNKKVIYQERTDSESNKIVGEILWAYRDGFMDIAVIKPKNSDFIKDFPRTTRLTIPSGHRVVSKDDDYKKTRIWFSGITSGNSEGHIIIHKNDKVRVKYADNDRVFLYDLIVFSKYASEPFEAPCKKGDSGAIIMDASDFTALGMIVASDDKFGYAIPMSDILAKHELALYTDPCLIKPIN